MTPHIDVHTQTRLNMTHACLHTHTHICTHQGPGIEYVHLPSVNKTKKVQPEVLSHTHTIIRSTAKGPGVSISLSDEVCFSSTHHYPLPCSIWLTSPDPTPL